jgi:hypothetical protein
MREPIYAEVLRSNITTWLFAGLALLFLTLFGWRVRVVGWKFVPGLFLFLGLFFVFYVINYRTLRIAIYDDTLQLTFGLVRWRIALENIQSCVQYDPPWWIKYGGAGVHFAQVQGVYQAFFNFLEGPRVLVMFKEKQGLVQALCFSTWKPDRVGELLGGKIT